MTELSFYEAGLWNLLELLGKNHPLHSAVMVYQQRLKENISAVRRYGDTESCRAERAEIVDRLNALAQEALGVSFNALCDEDKASSKGLPGTPTLSVDTSGGAYIGGNVKAKGGDFVGRDRRTINITGDGNVVGDHSSSTVVKHGDLDADFGGQEKSAEDYAYGIAQIVGCCGSEKLQVDNKYVLQTGVFGVIPQGFEAEPFLLPTEEEVIEFDITVFAEDINIEPYWTQSFFFHRDEGGDLLEFRLTPREAGTKDIKVEYYYRRHWLAQIHFEVEVIPARKTISD